MSSKFEVSAQGITLEKLTDRLSVMVYLLDFRC